MWWQIDSRMNSLGMDPDNKTYLFYFEKTYDVSAFNDYMEHHWTDSIIYSMVYFILIFGGQVYMSRRKGFELRPVLAMWSGFLAIFSIIGAMRTFPELVWAVTTHGFEYSCCNCSYNEQGKVTSFWTGLFVLSKLFELGDTVFIVLRKQPLIFLHWYHHITVLIYVWYSNTQQIGSGRWFIVMNYIVHAVMYTYYATRALKFIVPKWVNMFITTLQLIQMIFGIVVNVVAYMALVNGRKCQHNYTNIQFSSLMYFSYLILFAHFFCTTYIMQGHTHSKKKC